MGTAIQSCILHAGEGEALWSLGCLATFKATAELTGSSFSLVDEIAPRSEGTPLHRHVDDDESFFVIDGELVFHLGESGPISTTSEAFVHIPKGVPYAFRVESEHARYLILTTPHHEQFYRAIGTPAGRRELPPDAPWNMEMVMAAAERYDVEVLGAPPQLRANRLSQTDHLEPSIQELQPGDDRVEAALAAVIGEGSLDAIIAGNLAQVALH